MYVVVRCPRCTELMLANTDNETRSCTKCNHRANVRSLRVYGRAGTAAEAAELIKKLKTEEVAGEGYTPSFKRMKP